MPGVLTAPATEQEGDLAGAALMDGVQPGACWDWRSICTACSRSCATTARRCAKLSDLQCPCYICKCEVINKDWRQIGGSLFKAEAALADSTSRWSSRIGVVGVIRELPRAPHGHSLRRCHRTDAGSTWCGTMCSGPASALAQNGLRADQAADWGTGKFAKGGISPWLMPSLSSMKPLPFAAASRWPRLALSDPRWQKPTSEADARNTSRPRGHFDWIAKWRRSAMRFNIADAARIDPSQRLGHGDHFDLPFHAGRRGAGLAAPSLLTAAPPITRQNRHGVGQRGSTGGRFNTTMPAPAPAGCPAAPASNGAAAARRKYHPSAVADSRLAAESRSIRLRPERHTRRSAARHATSTATSEVEQCAVCIVMLGPCRSSLYDTRV